MLAIERFFRDHMNFRHMRILVALDDYRNVKRVAAYLNVTQPAVSKTLSGLEAGLGLKLFHRTNRGMEPTMLGASLIRHARDILGQLSEAQTQLREIAENRVSRISLGVLPTASVVIIPQFIARLESIASSTNIRITEGTMDRLLPSLRAGDADFVLGLLPNAPMSAEFRSELLIEDPLAVAVRRGHPLERVKRLSWEDVAQFPLILPPSSATTRLPIDAFLAAEDVTIEARRVETVSTMVVVGAIQHTDSIGFVSNSLGQYFERLGVVTILPIPVPDVQLRLGLIWLADRRYSESHQLVLEILREVCRGLGPAPRSGRNATGG
ncbi:MULTISPECIES: LysR family transcriptional regulator [Nitratireductor]|uniref:LysR family transcriptional regulator n=1 Tax=Nitratireductor TaxID=245876 RepID=UPI000D0DD69C|nr:MULTISPECIES: LysR substrate-binding domain-containing protein [Nitratireductor]PSM16421.1 hypothetical protein C7T96_20415 [Nitratireductor sp. StC3]